MKETSTFLLLVCFVLVTLSDGFRVQRNDENSILSSLDQTINEDIDDQNGNIQTNEDNEVDNGDVHEIPEIQVEDLNDGNIDFHNENHFEDINKDHIEIINENNTEDLQQENILEFTEGEPEYVNENHEEHLNENHPDDHEDVNESHSEDIHEENTENTQETLLVEEVDGNEDHDDDVHVNEVNEDNDHEDANESHSENLHEGNVEHTQETLLVEEVDGIEDHDDDVNEVNEDDDDANEEHEVELGVTDSVPEDIGVDGSLENNFPVELCDLDGSKMFLPNTKNCSQFYDCLNKEGSYCPHGMWFDPNYIGDTFCQFPEVICAADNNICDCAEKYPPPPIDPLIETSVSCLNDNRFHLIPSEVNCGRYFICHNDMKYRMECRQGLHYNSKTEMCDYPEVVNCRIRDPDCPTEGIKFLPDSTRCEVFYFCVHGFKTKQVCPFYHIWDINSNSCKRQDEVTCHLEE